MGILGIIHINPKTMAKVMIKCPVTGKPVFTGMDFPKNMDMSGVRNNSVGCPHCGRSHTWDGKDAYFED